jgi:hypothetical protein
MLAVNAMPASCDDDLGVVANQVSIRKPSSVSFSDYAELPAHPATLTGYQVSAGGCRQAVAVLPRHLR